MTAAKRVLLVGTFLSQSRHNQSVGEELAEQLSRVGWQVITTSSASTRLIRLLDMMTTVWRRRQDYDVAQVDVYSGRAFLWAEAVCWMLRRIRKPYVLTLHGGNLPAFAERAPDRVRRLLQSAQVVTAPSKYLLDRLQKHCRVIRLLPNPVDVRNYPFRHRRLAAPRLIWIRAFHKIYNPTMAPAVVAHLKSAHPSVHLTMVGPDRGDGSLQRTQEAARKLGVEDHVTFVGGVPKHEIPSWLAEGDVFVNTADIDNTPVTVMEAMACGLCVVSTDVGGLPYLLDAEQTGLLVAPRQPETMARAIGRLLSDPTLASRLSESARRKVECYGWRHLLPEWQTLLTDAAATIRHRKDA